MVPYRVFATVAFTLALACCASVGNLPINVATADPNAGVAAQGPVAPASEDDMIIGLAFSGGGTRAAAFSYGVLKGLGEVNTVIRGRSVSLVDRVDFVSGVSGGAVTAAYFGLKRRAALDDFRERFLIRDAEEALSTRVGLVNLGRGLSGGVNGDDRMRDWLDDNLFDHATFSQIMSEQQRPRVWINATDVYNRIPFIFTKALFSQICSDLGQYPIAEAVAASSAVPIVFSPIVLETYPGSCDAKMPPWLLKARSNPAASALLRAFAQGVAHQSDGSMKYIKLMDGGLVDNFGLSGFTITLEAAERPYEPLTVGEAVKLRRMMFLVVDAGGASKRDWADKLEGPAGADLVTVIADSTLEAAQRSSYSAFQATMTNWRNSLIRWRCALPRAEVMKYAPSAGWDCHNVQFMIDRISFGQFEKVRAESLSAIPTRLKLPVESVDELIAAGSDAVTLNPAYRKFLDIR